MKFSNLNNLIELFYKICVTQNPNEIFLTSLKDRKNSYTWQQTFECVQKFSDTLDDVIIENERCLLISENRPEWLISDLAIMLSKGITVPAYTTYTKKDYEYLIDDCKPSVIIISDQQQFEKINEIIKKKKLHKINYLI